MRLVLNEEEFVTHQLQERKFIKYCKGLKYSGLLLQFTNLNICLLLLFLLSKMKIMTNHMRFVLSDNIKVST